MGRVNHQQFDDLATAHASVPFAALIRPLLSIIVPVKNEMEAIKPFVDRIAPILDTVAGTDERAWEIIFVDDGSTDATLAVITAHHHREPRISILSLSRNFGKEAALSAGIDYAQGKAVIPMDVDMQDPPEAIPHMVEKWMAGADVVNGIRKDRSTDSATKRVSADLYYRIHNWLSNDKIPEHVGDFRLLDRKVVDVIVKMPERNRFMKGLFAWSGFRQESVEYEREEREVGQTKFRYWKLWTLALDGITSSSTVPLRVWSYLGGAVALAAFAYALFIVVRTLLFGVTVPGYSSLMSVMLFIGGLQLLSLGIMGEYVGRILTEVKQRPIYIVREAIGLELKL